MRWNHLSMAMLTDIGNVREKNEDAGGFDAGAGFCAVADGVGGAAAGEFASEAVVASLQAALADLPRDATPEERVAAMTGAIAQASQTIAEHAATHLLNSCGTTVAVLLFNPWYPDEAVALHVGDSRIYRLRDGALAPLTRDHTVAVEIGVHESELPRAYRDMLTQAVGMASGCQIERTPVNVQANDLFLVCTDGLYKVLSPNFLKRFLLSRRELSAAAQADELMREALSRRAPDNITFGIIQVGAPLPPMHQPSPEDFTRDRAIDRKHR
ncbi:MAG: protein phosphatase 2C domain-containing protein [Lentisphaeria bacterium]|nr:protein phosphatase 2C domain-containing protein [Lentisphaeria bacterium]